MENDKDYARLVAAQNESSRRLKIRGITNTLTEENTRRRRWAIASGVCIAGLIAAMHFSGIDPQEALQTELQALNSFDSLKEYLTTITPAMWASMVATAGAITNYLKHNRRYNKANREFYDMMDNQPTDYQDIVETQARNK